MKKLLAVLGCAVLMASSTFAIGFGVGAKGFLGTDLDSSASIEDTITAVKNLTTDSKLNYGFGAFTYLTIFGGLGVQAEANVTCGNTTISAVQNGQTKNTELNIWTLDVPLMLWIKSDISRFQLGIGVGPNFAFNLQSGDLQSLYEQASAAAKDNIFKIGLCAGIDAKLYVTDHIGIVAGARYINDFQKTDVPVTVYGLDTEASYPSVSVSRKALYGSVGVEYKLF